MVLTGVSSVRDAVYAIPAQRPTYIGHDLRALHRGSSLLAVGPQPGWAVDVGDGAVTVSGNGSDDGDGDGDGLSIVRAVASAVWGAGFGAPARIRAADDRARDALERWSLVHAD
jgi:glycerol-1-phosphatase